MDLQGAEEQDTSRGTISEECREFINMLDTSQTAQCSRGVNVLSVVTQ